MCSGGDDGCGGRGVVVVIVEEGERGHISSKENVDAGSDASVSSTLVTSGGRKGIGYGRCHRRSRPRRLVVTPWRL
jgi:hypothetical protein